MAQFVYPAVNIDTTGLATEAKQDDIITELTNVNSELDSQTALLTSLDGKDYATQTTLALLEAKDFATQTTLALLEGKDFSTETTLSALNTKVTAVDTTGKATEAKQDDIITQVTSIATNTSDNATETTLSALNTKVTAVDTTGKSTEAKQDDIITELSLDVVDLVDGDIIDVSTTNIPASASLPVQVVASLAADVKKILVVEDIGEFIGLYTGAASSEVLKCVLPLGGGEVKLEIPSGTRISLRHMKNTAITADFIAINFLG